VRAYLGGLPGPILFGFSIDHSCLIWEQKCDGSTGACLYYDNHRMAWLLMAVCVACKVFNILCGLLGWRIHEYEIRKDNRRPKTAVEHMMALGKTGSSQTENSYGSTDNITAEVNREEMDNPVEVEENNHLQ